MKILQCLSAVTILLAFVNIISVDCGKSLIFCKELKEALLTEENIYRLQNIIYPNDGSVASEVYLQVQVLQGQCNIYLDGTNITLYISTNNLWKINLYLQNILVFLKFTDLTFYNLMSKLTKNHGTNSLENFYPSDENILTLSNTSSICEGINVTDFEQCLISLFSWVKCYARAENILNIGLKMEQDRSLATIIDNNNSGQSASSGFDVYYFIPGIDVSMHCLVMIFGLYLLKDGALSLSALKKWKILLQIKIIVFWSAFFVLFVVNISCLLFEISIIRKEFDQIKKITTHNDLLRVSYILPFPFLIIEMFLILCCLRKHIGITSYSTFCFVKLVYSLAVCNMFWFAHRVANCFIVSMYFITVATAPTLNVNALCISLILISIAVISGIAYSCQSAKYKHKPCKKVCTTLLLLLILLCLATFITLFTILFLILTQDGLAVSNLGTVIHSLAIPLVMLVVTLVVKRYLNEVQSAKIEESPPINEEEEARESQPLLRNRV